MESKSAQGRDSAHTPARSGSRANRAAATPGGHAAKAHRSPDDGANAGRARGAAATLAPGTFVAHGKRTVAMSEEAYTMLLQVIYEHAPQIIKYAFYDMGYRTGVDLMAALGEQVEDPNAAFRQFVEQFQNAGYGTLEVLHFDLEAPEARIRGTNLFEAGLAPKADIYRSPRTVDHYSRGTFAGFMSELLKREVVCEEIACQFRGDPYCEFVVLPFQT